MTHSRKKWSSEIQHWILLCSFYSNIFCPKEQKQYCSTGVCHQIWLFYLKPKAKWLLLSALLLRCPSPSGWMEVRMLNSVEFSDAHGPPSIHTLNGRKQTDLAKRILGGETLKSVRMQEQRGKATGWSQPQHCFKWRELRPDPSLTLRSSARHGWNGHWDSGRGNHFLCSVLLLKSMNSAPHNWYQHRICFQHVYVQGQSELPMYLSSKGFHTIILQPAAPSFLLSQPGIKQYMDLLSHLLTAWKNVLKEPPFLLPGTNFAILDVQIRKTSLDVLCVQFPISFKTKRANPCTLFAEITEDVKQLVPSPHTPLNRIFLPIHATPSTSPVMATTSTFASSSGPVSRAKELQLNLSTARSLLGDVPLNQRSEIRSVLETPFLFSFIICEYSLYLVLRKETDKMNN